MKNKRLTPYLPSWGIFRTENLMFLAIAYMFTDPMITFNGYVFCMGDYVCWSAPVDDLGNWRYEGVIYPKTADPLNPEGKMCLYAPDVTVERTEGTIFITCVGQGFGSFSCCM